MGNTLVKASLCGKKKKELIGGKQTRKEKEVS